MNFIAVGFYTDNYKDNADRLISSCVAHGVPYYIERIADQGGWDANTHYKPTFIKDCLKKFNIPVLYVDADAEFKRYPELFDRTSVDIAYWRCNLENQNHLASGTLYFSINALPLIELWEKRCIEDMVSLDQTILDNIIKTLDIDTLNLPMEYCQIFDWPKQSVAPVIVHHQASRTKKHDRA